MLPEKVRTWLSKCAAVVMIAVAGAVLVDSGAGAHINTQYCGKGFYPYSSTDGWLYLEEWRGGTGWYHEHKYAHWNGGAGILHWGWTRCPYSH